MGIFGSTNISEDVSSHVRADVSREQFEACAVAAGWTGETIHEFLRPAFWKEPNFRVHVGRRWLKITDWQLIDAPSSFRR